MNKNENKIAEENSAQVAPEKVLVKIKFESGFVDLRKGKGWAAVLRVNDDGEIERDFIDINRLWGKRGFVFTFEGEYPIGTVIEISEGGSWKNTYRSYNLVTAEGLKQIGWVDSIKAQQELMKILRVPALKWAWKSS